MMLFLLRLLVLPLLASMLCDAFTVRIPAAMPTITSPSHSSVVDRAPFFQRSPTHRTEDTSSELYQASFAADGSEYSSKDGGKGSFDDDESDQQAKADYDKQYVDFDQDETPTVEQSPVPMSKNGGNRFVAFIWDRELTEMKNENGQELDGLDLHYNRIALTEEHVMYCRKANLYNETFNAESMVDVLWSLPILASDLQRVIGHAMCLESTELRHVQDFLAKEPIIQMLTGGNLDNIPLYRWRHLRDYSLRIDDGRFGYPCMCLAMDEEPEVGGESASLREEVNPEVLEYWIESKKIIAAGALHMPTEFKDDPSSIPVGDLMLFNAKNRDDAIEFAENMPSAEEGLYQSMRVYFYNNLDITGKFVSEDPLRDSPCDQLKEAMEVWGYPVADDQTPWLNW